MCKNKLITCSYVLLLFVYLLWMWRCRGAAGFLYSDSWLIPKDPWSDQLPTITWIKLNCFLITSEPDIPLCMQIRMCSTETMTRCNIPTNWVVRKLFKCQGCHSKRVFMNVSPSNIVHNHRKAKTSNFCCQLGRSPLKTLGECLSY